MLFITEIAEAFEDIRKHGVHKQSEHIPDYSVEEEELADVCIRIFDWAGGIGLRLGSAINAKLEFNGNRPHLHGKLF
jgi:NTP pyrophosphatase (non-canonical NTP hydrolase)